MSSFGLKLKQIRVDILKMTQQEFADSIHFTQAAVNAIETGKNKKASFEMFRQMVIIHNINPWYFIFEKSNEPAILKREGNQLKSLLQKNAKYEKLIGQLTEVMKGK